MSSEERKLKFGYQADFDLVLAVKPQYQFQKIVPNTGGGSVALSLTTPQPSIFNLPGSDYYNLQRAYLTANGIFAASTNVQVLLADVVPIQAVELKLNSTKIADLQNVQIYSKVSQALCTNMADYLSRGGVYSGVDRATSFYSENRCLQPASTATTISVTASPASAPTMQYLYSATAGTIAYSGVGTAAIPVTVDALSDKCFVGRQRVITNGANGAGAILNVQFNIPFKAFMGSILAVDKDIKFGQNAILTINWSPMNNFISDVATGGTLAGANIAKVGAGSLNDITLWLPVEKQPDIISKLDTARSLGFSMYIPFTEVYQNSKDAVGVLSATIPLSNVALKRILNVPVNANNNLGFANSGDNVNGHLYSTVWSRLDSEYLQPQVIACGTNSEDYSLLYPLIKDSPAGMSLREFQMTPFWLDNFADGLQSTVDLCDNDVVNDGRQIVGPQKNYNIQMTCTRTGGMLLYSFVTTTKTLSFLPGGMIAMV